MFMSTLYTLSDGTITKSRPYLYDKRDKLIEQAKIIENNLKYTKRLKGKDFINVWLNDLGVIEYRRLLRQIWGFQQEIFIVSEKTCCEESECNETEGLVKVEYTSNWKGSSGFIFTDVFCPKCLKEKQEFWGEDRTYTIVGKVE
jgi:hypothetical protein